MNPCPCGASAATGCTCTAERRGGATDGACRARCSTASTSACGCSGPAARSCAGTGRRPSADVAARVRAAIGGSGAGRTRSTAASTRPRYGATASSTRAARRCSGAATTACRCRPARSIAACAWRAPSPTSTGPRAIAGGASGRGARAATGEHRVILRPGSPGWPEALDELADPPAGLYLRRRPTRSGWLRCWRRRSCRSSARGRPRPRGVAFARRLARPGPGGRGGRLGPRTRHRRRRARGCPGGGRPHGRRAGMRHRRRLPRANAGLAARVAAAGAIVSRVRPGTRRHRGGSRPATGSWPRSASRSWWSRPRVPAAR